MKTTLTVEIEYNPTMTDPEGLACAMDRLLEMALSIPDIMEEYGNPTVNEFFVAKEAIPAPKVVLNLSGGVLQDVFGSHPATTVVLVDWDVEGCSPSDDGIVEVPDVRGGTQLAAVADYPVWPLERLAGTETEAALKAAGLAAGSNQTLTRRWVLYSMDSDTLLTTRTYDRHDEAVQDAAQVDDVLVLPLTIEQIDL
jgi:hypothetical protein